MMRNHPTSIRALAILLTLPLFAIVAPGARAEDPPVIAGLIGIWEGQGTLFGSAAEFSMTWEHALGDKFVRLTFENRMRASNDSIRVLRAEAFYRATENGRLEGTWFDSRGMVLPLMSESDVDTLTTLWGTPETEQGRTVYRLTDTNEVQVEDYVLKNGEWRQFGQATYRRSKESGTAVMRVRVGEGTVTDRNQTFPAEDPSGDMLWFSVYDDSFDAQTIMFAHRTDSGWSAPEVAPFSGRWGDRAPRFSPDGTTLYFTSNRPIEAVGSSADANIWRVARVGGEWGTPEPVPSINSDAADMHASATDSAIWLASTREGSLGRSDIYRVAPVGSVEHLPAPINDENSQPDLWVSPDETWMILVITDHPDGFGGDDLYISRFDGKRWTAPVNLGSEVNSEKYEYGPSVSANGKYLYFTSHRSGTAGVYRVPVSSVMATNP